ncbi:hypothetical protein BDY24DRAFT_389815 [Mrakia frigida]|uniref:uncharacterized protein n=1 Tax=Mrakia frigida TaxID=29902 RepID=UPI003FCC0B70
MPLLLCRLCGELVSSSADRCRCGGSTRQTSTLATSPSTPGEGPVDRWQKKYVDASVSNLFAFLSKQAQD